MNIVILMGRLTADPEMRYTQNGSPVANFTLAVQRNYKKDGGPTADYIYCTVLKKGIAEFCGKYLRKGTKIIIQGDWRTGSYVNQKNEKVYTNTCLVGSIEFAESRGKVNCKQTPTPVPPPSPDIPSIPEYDPELPFN